MDIFLDHEKLETDAGTFAEIIDASREVLEPQGRIVVEVRLDGETLQEEDLQSIDEKLKDVIEMQLITAEPKELAIQALRDSQSVLVTIRDEQHAAGALLQEEDQQRAMEKLKVILGQWFNVQQTVEKTAQLIGLTLDEIGLEEISLTDAIQRLADRLMGLREALISQDWIAISDSLSYELEEDVDDWNKLLEEVIKQVEGK